MADLHKRDDRADWLTWAIEFLRRGLWLDEEITVHGPHDASGVMWGEATARIDGQQWGPCCAFRAYAKRSKYRPTRITIYDADDERKRFPVLGMSDLTPKARKWLRAARVTRDRLRREFSSSR